MKTFCKCLYLVLWLHLLTPLTIFLLLGCLAGDTPSLLELIGVLGGTYYYYTGVWMPIRRKFKDMDDYLVRRCYAR